VECESISHVVDLMQGTFDAIGQEVEGVIKMMMVGMREVAQGFVKCVQTAEGLVSLISPV
jgi:hypothetical protein